MDNLDVAVICNNAGGELTVPERCKIKLSSVICGRISRAPSLGMICVGRTKSADDTSSGFEAV